MPWWAYPAACFVLVGMVGGWVLGYAHREFVELGRTYGRAWADIVHLWTTGELRPGRLASAARGARSAGTAGSSDSPPRVP
jgi:hypothetical protein